MNDVILVVDDERDLALTCQRLLTRCGWQVTTVGSRQAALAALTSGAPPALAVIDRLLPDGDGLELVRPARTHGTPVIVISALTSSAKRAEALDEGAAAFLGKPFSARDFLDTVRTVAGEPPRV